jgi:hypothetical protein
VSLDHEEVANPSALVRQWGREHRIPPAFTAAVEERVSTLEEPVTRYALLNLFNSFQHPDVARGPVRPGVRERLQELAGAVAAESELRCRACGRTVGR